MFQLQDELIKEPGRDKGITGLIEAVLYVGQFLIETGKCQTYHTVLAYKWRVLQVLQLACYFI